MSAAAIATLSGQQQGSSTSREAKAFLWITSVAWMGLLGWQVPLHSRMITNDLPSLLPWMAALAVIALLPLGGVTAQLAPDLPICIAGALVLSPVEIGLVAFLASLDVREFQGKVDLSRALFNRSQVGLACFAGALVVSHVATPPSLHSPAIMGFAVLALVVDAAVNYILVATYISLDKQCSLATSLMRLRIGSLLDYSLTFGAWVVLGAMLAALYDQIGGPATLAFLIPTLLGRQLLDRSQAALGRERAYRSREHLVSQLSEDVFRERSDERRLIAADLHDEVLQPLFKVTLMGHVLKADLGSGKLLEIEDDLPELLTAAEAASNSLRNLIGDLRKSTLGRGGLASALSSLARSLERQSPARLHFSGSAIKLPPNQELGVYQIAKEALGNAIAHSKAEGITLSLSESDEAVNLRVSDNGVGFDPVTGKEDHYGLHIMRERASAIGAHLFVDSAPGKGCHILLIVPKPRS